jgi:hypothetical protein
MSESAPYSTNDEAYEQLVAYLDGELDAETSKQVERRLAENVEYRRELQELQRAWDMLDELPRAEVSESFTQTTVEMVALSAARELTAVQGQIRQRQRFLWGGVGAGAVLVALTSYLAVSAYFARPNAALLRDLPVIQNRELYEVADSVEFLRQLEATRLFAEESESARAHESPPPPVKLDQMLDAEKATLLQKKNRFDELSWDKQQHVRQIHDAMSRDPRQAELQRVLKRYHAWLVDTLTVAERATVLGLPADQRIEKITELVRAQQAKRFRMMASGFMMSPQDLAVIRDWFDKFLDDHADEILAAWPDDPLHADLKQNYDRDRDRYRLRFDYAVRRDHNRPQPSAEEVARLQTLVSKEAQQVLADADEKERSEIVLRWIGAAVLSLMRTNPSVEELDEFAHNRDFVSDAERAWLESLPRDSMLQQLRVLYKQRRFAGDASKKSPWDRGRGGSRQAGPGAGPDLGGPPPPGMPDGRLGKPDGPPPLGDLPPAEPPVPPSDPGK